MFEITPSSEFSAWFETLTPALAEEVSYALDLLAEIGVGLGPSQASRALLWFDGCGGGITADLLSRRFGLNRPGPALGLGDDVQELLLWRREAARSLESEAFRRRFGQLEPKAASLALRAIDVLKSRLDATRARIALGERASAGRRLTRWGTGLSAREARALEQHFGLGELPDSSLTRSLKDAFFEVLRLVGLEPSQLMNALSGLCELTINSSSPRLHVLFGLDAPAQRVVVLLGEPLTRSYYGDSVKLAERRWQQYCAGESAQLSTP